MYLPPTYKNIGKTLFDIPDDTEVKVEIYSGHRGMLTIEEKETTAGELKKEILESFAAVSDRTTDRYAIRPRFDI